jgi:hypothetical protein
VACYSADPEDTTLIPACYSPPCQQERFQGFESQFLHHPERYNPDVADVVFMRWKVKKKCCFLIYRFVSPRSRLLTFQPLYYIRKERFLVSDTSVDAVDGASFAGFYYIKYVRSTGSITGYYYHRTSEWWVEPAKMGFA